MSQISLLPIRLVDEPPYDRSKGGGKDLLWLGIDEQDRRYALKTVEPDNPCLPLVEWLCYHLCMLAGIPSPDFSIVERLDGSLAFGSRWAEDATQFSRDEHSEQQLQLWVHASRADMSAMLALDAFLPNDDRHFRNVLFRQVGSRMRALAFDWSRAAPFEPWPWARHCNSSQAAAWCRSLASLDYDASLAAVSRLAATPEAQVKSILESAPEAWCASVSIDAMVLWWRTQRQARAEQSLAMLYK